MKKHAGILAIAAILIVIAAPSFAWKFAVMGDTQGTGGSDVINVPVMTDIVNRINGEGAAFVLQHGDASWGYCDDSCLSSQMDTWLSIMNGLNCPWYYCPGNHEIGDRSTTENVLRGKVNQPLNGPAGYEEMVFSFDYDTAHIVALNSDHYGEQHRVQRSWLTGNLAGTNKPHVFVMAHEPAYPRGPNVGVSLDYYPSERDDFWRIMSDDNVSMYFCGHEHFFARQLTNGVYQINNGTSGAPIYTGYGAIEDYHYVVIDINGLNVSCQVKNRYGTLLDSWSYTAPAAQSPFAGVIPLPGVIQAENYDVGVDGVSYHDTSSSNDGGAYRTDGVDVETTGDTGGGYNIGWINANEWQEYSVNVAGAGDYSLKMRVASPSGGGNFHILLDGSDVTGVKSFTATGGWQTYTTVIVPARYLAAGQHTLRVVVDPGGGWNWNYLDVVSHGPEAVSVDLGNPDVNDSMNNAVVSDGDMTPTSIGGHNCRVNVNPNEDTFCYFNISSLYAYQGNKPDAYITIEYYDTGTGSLTLQYDALSDPYKNGGSVALTNSNTWKTYTWHVTDAYFGNRENGPCDFRVARGVATFYIDTAVVQASAVSGQTPYAGVIQLPGTIQAENFDNGGENVAYHDYDSVNSGGQYRSTGVDIENCSDTGGGYNTGWMSAGEWLEWTVNVVTAGDHDFYMRVASGEGGGTFRLLIDNTDISGARSFAGTGGWQNWTTIIVPARYLAAGQHIFRVNVESGGWNLNKVDVFSRGADAVSIDMGNPDIMDGITHIQVSDGDTVPWTAAGHNCRENVWYDDVYMYFSVSSAWAWQGNKPDVYITFDYYDLATGQLGIDYDSTSNPYKHVNGPTLTGTGTWKTYTFHVTDAYFGNRQNGGSDFRFTAGAYEWGIDAVTVYQ